MKVRGKPNVDAFLDGGNEAAKAPVAAPSKAKPVQAADEPPKRTKKLFELPEAMIADLELSSLKCLKIFSTGSMPAA